ncbi:MAG: ISKra4 family transposase, partial [Tannerella sp.]|nr:ISKra4 family transposase [Tannerella sp.]
FTEACHRLRDEEGGTEKLLKEMQGILKRKITDEKKKELSQSITCLTNHIHQMKYPEYLDKKNPTGSGVIEAACKIIIRQSMCNSGMKWSDYGAKKY